MSVAASIAVRRLRITVFLLAIALAVSTSLAIVYAVSGGSGNASQSVTSDHRNSQTVPSDKGIYHRCSRPGTPC